MTYTREQLIEAVEAIMAEDPTEKYSDHGLRSAIIDACDKADKIQKEEE